MRQFTNNKHFLLFVMPVVIVILMYSYLPFLYGIFLSVTEINPDAEGVIFSGMKNFSRLLTDADFINSFLVTVEYIVISVSFMIIGGLGLALAISYLPSYGSIYLVIFFISWIISETVTSTLWSWMLDQDYGILNYIFNIPVSDLLINPKLTIIGISLITFWRGVAFITLIFLSALQSIPKELYETAYLDGVGFIKRLFKITIPLISKTIVVMTIFLSIGALQQAGMILVLTNGGPRGASETIGLFMYKQAFQYFELHYAAAISMFILLINVICTIAYFTISKLKGSNT